MSVTVRRIASVLGLLLLLAVIAPFAVYAVPEAVGADHSFVVLTASMTPEIEPGDAVIVAERDPATIQEGDVITFLRGTSEVPVTHRVIGVVESEGGIAFETMGDANEAPDAGVVPAANVLGVVVVAIPYIGYVIQFANSEYGFIALIVVPFGLLALNEAWAFYRRSTSAQSPAPVETGELAEAEQTPEAGEISTTGEQTDGDTTEAEEIEIPEAKSETAGGTGPFVITSRTLEGAFLVLLGGAPYSVYMAYTVQTTLAVSVAFAATMLLVVLVGALVPAWRSRSRDSSEPSTLEAPSTSDELLTPGRPITSGGPVVGLNGQIPDESGSVPDAETWTFDDAVVDSVPSEMEEKHDDN